MNEKKLLALWGLSHNPFLPTIPADCLWSPPGVDLFFNRVEALVRRGGFALIVGEPGMGKSKVLQLLAGRLDGLGELTVGVMERPQSHIGDFYRELGDLFGVTLTPANRYGGFRALRARWRGHLKSTLMRPVLLVDEAQQMGAEPLSELRILSSAHFDSECLLTTVLCEDGRLSDRLRSRDLLPLDGRIRTRLVLDPYAPQELGAFLDHAVAKAGGVKLMTDDLKRTLCEHAGGNLRTLANMAAELLDAAVERELSTLDDELFFEVFAKSIKTPRQKKPRRRS
jgi:general secretion pathway protein A